MNPPFCWMEEAEATRPAIRLRARTRFGIDIFCSRSGVRMWRPNVTFHHFYSNFSTSGFVFEKFRFCSFWENNRQTIFDVGGSPTLVVMGDNSCLRGCMFESRYCYSIDRTFLHWFVVKMVLFDENIRKRGRAWSIKTTFDEGGRPG